MNPTQPPSPPPPTPPTYQSRDLFQDGKVVVIVHEGREYQLRITQAGKLILTA
jgi:hemin uptake protein HemP